MFPLHITHDAPSTHSYLAAMGGDCGGCGGRAGFFVLRRPATYIVSSQSSNLIGKFISYEKGILLRIGGGWNDHVTRTRAITRSNKLGGDKINNSLKKIVIGIISPYN